MSRGTTLVMDDYTTQAGSPTSYKAESQIDDLEHLSLTKQDTRLYLSTMQTKFDPSSLAEQSESIKQIWLTMVQAHADRALVENPNSVQELPLKAVLMWLVDECIALDKEKAAGVVDAFLGKSLMTEG